MEGAESGEGGEGSFELLGRNYVEAESDEGRERESFEEDVDCDSVARVGKVALEFFRSAEWGGGGRCGSGVDEVVLPVLNLEAEGFDVGEVRDDADEDPRAPGEADVFELVNEVCDAG